MLVIFNHFRNLIIDSGFLKTTTKKKNDNKKKSPFKRELFCSSPLVRRSSHTPNCVCPHNVKMSKLEWKFCTLPVALQIYQQWRSALKKTKTWLLFNQNGWSDQQHWNAKKNTSTTTCSPSTWIEGTTDVLHSQSITMSFSHLPEDSYLYTE